MNQPSSHPVPNRWLGYLAGLGVIAIWSGFIVFARFGVKGNLTPYDVTALRFMVGALVALPFVFRYWPHHLSSVRILVLMATGPGVVYSVLMYNGLNYSPAAFAGVFANGTMPIFTAIFAWALLGERLGKTAFIAIAIIIAGSVAVGYENLSSVGTENLIGLPFFIIASFFLAAYVVLLRLWNLTSRQILAIINLPSALVFLPLWWFALPSTIGDASLAEIALQALFQGLGPSFLALIFFTYAIQTIGATPVAAFAASVPATAALLAIPVLGERLNIVEWSGVLAVTAGLALLILRR